MKSKSTLIDRGVLVVESSGDDAAIIGEANALKAMADRMTAEVLFTLVKSVWWDKDIRTSSFLLKIRISHCHNDCSGT